MVLHDGAINSSGVLPSEISRFSSITKELWNSFNEEESDDVKLREEAFKDGFEWISIEEAIHAHTRHSSMDSSYSEAYQFHETVCLSRLLFEHIGRLGDIFETKFQLILTPELSYEIARQIISLSQDEPCGVSGCHVQLLLIRKDGAQLSLNTFCFDSYKTPTFEIKVLLTEDYRKGFFNFHNIFCRLGFTKSVEKLFVTQPVAVEKRCFYRSLNSSLMT